MAARPVSLSLAALSLTFGLVGGIAAVPALAQNAIGSGNIVFNPQALDQLGGGGSFSGTAPTLQAPLLGATGRGSKATKQSAKQARTLPLASSSLDGPQPLVGETGRSASAIKLHPPRASTATRKASATTTAPKAAAPAAVAMAPVPAPVPAPTPAPQAVAPAPTPAPAPAPVIATPTLAPVAPRPAPAAPNAPTAVTPAPAPVPQAVAPAPAPAPVPAPAPQAAAPAPTPATAPAPAPAPVPAPAPQVAAAPPAPRPVPAPSMQNGVVTIAFPGGQGDLPAGDLAGLDALARQFASGEDRLQIRAYAANSVADGGSGARRLSLTRALAVRQYLIDKGIRSTRIDVRALGAPGDGGTPDRVEIAPVGR